MLFENKQQRGGEVEERGVGLDSVGGVLGCWRDGRRAIDMFSGYTNKYMERQSRAVRQKHEG